MSDPQHIQHSYITPSNAHLLIHMCCKAVLIIIIIIIIVVRRRSVMKLHSCPRTKAPGGGRKCPYDRSSPGAPVRGEAMSCDTGNIPEAPELGTPRFYGQNFGSQWCPLLRGSTVYPCWHRKGYQDVFGKQPRTSQLVSR